MKIYYVKIFYPYIYMNEIDYKRKYLKYKKKYLELKELQGSGLFSRKKKKGKKKISLKGLNKNLLRIVKLATKIKPILNLIDKHSGKIELLAKGASIGATVASLGLGGDTVVELGMVSLDVLGVVNQIVDILSLFDNKNFRQIVVDIIGLKFTGIDDTLDQYESINDRINQLENSDMFIEQICGPLQNLLGKLGDVIGNLVSTGIPNDNFIASTIIQKLIGEAIDKGSVIVINKTVDGINEKYDKIPESFQEVLENPEKMAKKLKKLFKFLITAKKIMQPKSLILKDSFDKLLSFMLKNRKAVAIMMNKVIALVYFSLNFMRDNCIDEFVAEEDSIAEM